MIIKHFHRALFIALMLMLGANAIYLNASDFSLSFVQPAADTSTIYTGQRSLVKWQAQGTMPSQRSYYKLFFRCSGNQNWRTITTLKSTVSQYNWQVPNSPLTDCQLALVLYVKSSQYRYSVYSKTISSKFNIIKPQQSGQNVQSSDPVPVVSGNHPAGEILKFPQNLPGPALVIYPDINIVIPNGYVYSPSKD